MEITIRAEGYDAVEVLRRLDGMYTRPTMTPSGPAGVQITGNTAPEQQMGDEPTELTEETGPTAAPKPAPAIDAVGKKTRRSKKQETAVVGSIGGDPIPVRDLPTPAAEPAPTPAPIEAKDLSENEIKKVVEEYRDKVGNGSTAGLISKLKDAGVKRITELPKDKIVAFVDELRAEIAKVGK